MKVWKVGGAVRDALLGRPITDVDWVVTGATPDDMLAAGYTPVGRDFPVFLHPITKQEYALARTERKTAPGYHGFVFHTDANVTLEQDLQRRDLTINAMAQDADGVITDPYGGQRDLQAKLLRHVSPAFAEDPVRILRVARFAARFGDFDVAPETRELMRVMVGAGEVDALVAERVWQELSHGLMETHPSRMLDVLHDCGALARLLPEIDVDWSLGSSNAADPLRRALDLSARRGTPLAVRFAVLTHRLDRLDQTPAAAGKAPAALRSLCERWRVPSDCREVAEGVGRERESVRRSDTLGAEDLVRLLDRCDAWRRPERFDLMLVACECIGRAEGRIGDADRQPPHARLRRAWARAAAVDAGAAATRATQLGLRGPEIASAVRTARVRSVSDDPADETND
ncbi:MAG: multifunctional CCA addition/repair protein [Burkholderiaceae bacterium]|nr:multifunctional CCA addition/repair protein [Burkholderiaceae bacterium]